MYSENPQGGTGLQVPHTHTHTHTKESKMSETQKGRTGYEIRAELLKLARDIVETNIHMARENRDNTRPKYFSTEDVISEANKLYSFVQNKN